MEHNMEKKVKLFAWEPRPTDYYEITGVDRSGKRFLIRTKDWFYASGINVWRGTKWLVRDGRRQRITKVTN
jgi:hypothetical protein